MNVLRRTLGWGVVAAALACNGAAWASSGAPAGAPSSAGRDLLVESVKAYAGHESIRARFTQAYRSRVIQREHVESGEIAIRKPGLMRWAYDEPKGKLFVVNEEGSFMVIPADRQVWTGPRPDARKDDSGLLVGLLTGRADPQSMPYGIEEMTAAPGGARVLSVTPVSEADFDHALLEIDPANLLIRAVTVFDALGNVTVYTFFDFSFDTPADKGLFSFVIPKGYDVLKDSL